MPLPVSPNDIAQLRVWVQDVEQASVNTFHYQILSIVGNPSLETFTSHVDATIAADYKDILWNGAEYRGIQAFLLNKLPPPAPVVVITNAGSGTGGADGIPRQACGISTWLTKYRGSRYRGRTFWPFPPIGGDEGSGKPNAAYIAAVNGLANALLGIVSFGSGGNTGTCEMVVWSEKFTSSQSIESVITRDKWGTLKKRGSYGRANASPI